MKLILALAGALLALTLSGVSAAPIATDSNISAVTVYVDRAVVTRTASLDVPAAGAVELTFDKLPASLLDHSLQVAGTGTAQTTLLDVSARPTFVDFTPNDRVKSLEDDLRALNRQDRTLADRVTVLGQQRDYVLKIQNATTAPARESAGVLPTPDLWISLLKFSGDQLSRISDEQQALDLQREDLQAKRTALERQLNELRGAGGHSYKTVTVRLAAATAGRRELTLRYAVPGASWTPGYDARARSDGPVVQLGYFGLVRQNTGEDWKNVDLTLSTARPSLGGAAPELPPWIVQPRQILPASIETQEAGGDLPLKFGGEPRTMFYAANRIGLTLRDAATPISVVTPQFLQDTAVVQAQATSATFRIPVATDVPSDNAPHKIGVVTFDLTTDPSYRSTPKLVPTAFLTAKVTNTSDFPLLAGPMNVFLDDTFVATSTLRSVMPGEKFELALGADDGIAVKRKLNHRFTEDTGLMTKGRRITYDYTTTVQNNKKTAVKIVVLDQVPVSRNGKIVVKILVPDEPAAKPETDGTLQWTLSLAPGEKREIPLKFSIAYPNDVPVTGLE